MRGHYISAIKSVRNEYNTRMQLLQARECECGELHASLNTDVTYRDLLEARRKLTLHYSDLAQTSLVKRVESLFDQGDKNGKLLALLVADRRAQTGIPCIKSMQGVLVTEIMVTFVQYYSMLYVQIPTYSKAEQEQLLAPMSLPTLSAIDRNT